MQKIFNKESFLMNFWMVYANLIREVDKTRTGVLNPAE